MQSRSLITVNWLSISESPSTHGPALTNKAEGSIQRVPSTVEHTQAQRHGRRIYLTCLMNVQTCSQAIGLSINTLIITN